MAIVNREWEGKDVSRVLKVSDCRGIEEPYFVTFEAGIKKLGGLQAAAEYGIKAAISDAGSAGKSAKAKIDAAKTWVEGSPDKAALVAELQAKEVEWAKQYAEAQAEIAKLREAMGGR